MKKIFIFLAVVFSLLSANGIAVAQKKSNKEKKEISVVKEARSPLNEQIATIRGLMNSYVKVNENDHPVFQNFPQNKRSQANSFSWTSSAATNACYASYSRARNNSIHTSPFYIAYHRLTV